MKKADLATIRARTEQTESHAERIYSGDADNYDGADGCREVLELCATIAELVDALEPFLTD